MRERAAPVQCNVAAGAAELGGENEINSRDQFTLTAKDKPDVIRALLAASSGMSRKPRAISRALFEMHHRQPN
jgi:hypothetical protein